ncbi:GrpE protein-like protein, mitochondrial [Erysiphe neolycopersici]|uniref:GrpE protein homolog n=1 Tax=Erysiphe neolycopersici TaxID=212602 RepID=A0A420HGN5_9PEZI|nr:GrpE protein-like protein, mitochondrial [Erysiphe neolycopersici]
MIRRAVLRQGSSLRTFSLFHTRILLPTTSIIRPNQPINQISNSKWYSTEPIVSDEQKSEKDEKSKNGGEAQNTSEEDPISKELEAKKREIIDLKPQNSCLQRTKKDRYLRSIADFRNLQERTKRDMQAARDFAIQKFAKDLIESVDNLDRALSIVPQEKLTNPDNSEDRKQLISLYEGLKMTEEVLMNTLKKNGLERFDPSAEGVKFDPNEHEATFMVPIQGKEDNTVFDTQQKGFKLHGRVLRAAKVGVVKNS